MHNGTTHEGASRARRKRWRPGAIAVLLCLSVAVSACTKSGRPDDASGSTASTVAGLGPGVTDTTVTIGFAYPDLAALAQSGVLNVDPGSYPDAVTTLVDDLNERGGINGRTVEVIPVAYPVLQSEGMAATCLRLTEDDRVLAVLGGFRDANNTCFTQDHDTPVFGVFGSPRDRSTAEAGAGWFSSRATASRSAEALAEILGRTDRLSGHKVAVLATTAADQPVVRDDLVPALRAAGADVVVTSLVDVPSGDVGALNAALEVEAERMKAAGVDTVVATLFAGAPFVAADFLPDVYLVNREDARALIQGGGFDPTQFPVIGAVGNTSLPGVVDPTQQRCFDAWNAAHPDRPILGTPEEERAAGRRSDRGAVANACAALEMFELAAKGAGADLNASTLRAAVGELGDVTLPGIGAGSLLASKFDAQDDFRLDLWNPSQGVRGNFVPTDATVTLGG